MVSNKWSDHEFEIAVITYFRMLKMEHEGVIYKKSNIRKDVVSNILNNRTEASYEFRMRNISAVMSEMGLKYIKGYRPALNVGNGAKLIVRRLIEKELSGKECLNNTVDEDLLNKRVQILKDKIDLSLIPLSNNTPKSVERTSKTYERSPFIKAWVIQNADGKCEACGVNSTFKTKQGDYYLEVHHMKPLAFKGTDSISNTIALCPNCHKRLHYSIDKIEYMEFIYASINRLKKE